MLGERWQLKFRQKTDEYSLFISTVWLSVRHLGGTYETYIDYAGPGGNFDDVVSRYQTRIEAIQAHVKLEQDFAERAGAVLAPERTPEEVERDPYYQNWDFAAIAQEIVDATPSFILHSECCGARLSSESDVVPLVRVELTEDSVVPCFCSNCGEPTTMARLQIS